MQTFTVSQRHNKQFKSDSARLAFLVWVWLSVYGVQIKCRGCVLHTLIGRYVTEMRFNEKGNKLERTEN
ncbi:hypothetical protein CGG88_24175 [Vibrio parahaemolyticus]|nr:hypothetical protein CGG88_24175 [Vibrio parahaemolyticus]